MKNIGRNMAIAGAAITAAFGYAVKGSMDFEAKLKRVEIQSGATASEMAEIKKTALNEEFVKLGKSGNQVADMYNRLASEGYDVAAMKKMLIPITEATIVLGTEEGETTKLMLNLMQQYNLTASDMGHISDVLAGALANTSFQGGELAEVMKYAGVAAGELGWSLEGTIPIVDAIIKVTGEASMAGTQFRMMIMKLRVPTETMKEEFSKVGITLDEVAEAIKTPIGLVELLSKAHEKGANFAAMFGARAGSAAAVIARQSVPAIEALTEKVNETGFAHEAAGGMMETTAGQVEQALAEWQNLRTEIGDFLIPILKDTLLPIIQDVLKNVREWVKENPELTETIVKWGAAIGVLMLGLGPLLMILPGLIAGIGLLTKAIIAISVAIKALAIASGPIGLLILAVGGLYLAWEKNLFGMRDITDKVFASIKGNFVDLQNTLGGGGGGAGAFFDDIKESSDDVTESFDSQIQKLQEAQRAYDVLQDFLEPVRETILELTKELTPYEQKIADVNAKYDDMIEAIKMFNVTEEEQKIAIEKVNIARDLAITKLEEAKTAAEKLAEAKKKLADMTKSLTDKIYEFIHTDYEVKLRDINREYDLLIENAKEVYESEYELVEAIKIINEKRQEEIDILKESNELKKEATEDNKDLADSYGELKKPIEEVTNNIEKLVGFIGVLPSKLEMFLGKMESYFNSIVGKLQGLAYTLGFTFDRWEDSLEDVNGATEDLANTTANTTNSIVNSWNNVTDAINRTNDSILNIGNVVATTKSWNSYQHGTPYVPKTGLAIVHRGEEINPPGQRSYDNRKSSYSPTININNPVVRNDSDLIEIERMINNALEKSARQYDRRGYELAPGMG